MAGMIEQVGAVTDMSIRTIPQRIGASMVIVAGIAGVVGVMVALLAMAEGFRQTLASTGKADRVIVLRAGSIDELGSVLGIEQARILQDLPNIRKDGDGKPIVMGEKYVLTNVPKKGSDSPSNVVVRGTQTDVARLRPEFKLVGGRMFEAGRREAIAGRGAASEYDGLDVGGSVEVRDGAWTVVGVFETGGDVHESEIWVDDNALRDAMRSSYYSSLTVQLEDDRPETLRSFKDLVTQDPRLVMSVQREPDYYASRSQALDAFITGLGYTVAVIMAAGALFGALNSMYAAVATRTTEIATLRAIGFGGAPVVISVMIEAMLLALVGGVVGAALAWLFFNGLTVSTLNFQTFSQVAFAFRVTPELLVQGVLWALVIGLLGGLFPAVRAARMPVVDALRAN